MNNIPMSETSAPTTGRHNIPEYTPPVIAAPDAPTLRHDFPISAVTGTMLLSRDDDKSNLNFIPKNLKFETVFYPEEYKNQELRNMTDWVNAEYDPEAKARVEKVYGTYTTGIDFSVGAKIARTEGFFDYPELWFYHHKKPIPEVKDITDLYDAIASEFRADAKKEWEKQQAQIQKANQQQESINRTFRDYVAGRVDDKVLKDGIAAADMLLINPKQIDLLDRSRAAYQWTLNYEDQGFFEKTEPKKLLSLLKGANEEETRVTFLAYLIAMEEKTKNAEGTEELNMFGNFTSALQNSIANLLTAGGESAREAVSAFGSMAPAGELSTIAQRVQLQNIPKYEPNILEEQERRQLQFLSNIISEYEEAQQKTNGAASLYIKALNGLSRIAGESAPAIAGGVVGGMPGVFALAGGQGAGDSYRRSLTSDVGWDGLTNQENINKAHAEMFIDGVTNGLVESIFGLTAWGAKGLMGKFLSYASREGALGGAARAAGRGMGVISNAARRGAASFAGSRAGHFVLSNTWARIGVQALGGAGEELILENLVQSPIDYIQRSLYRAVGVNVDPGTITISQDIASAISDPETSAGTLLFSLMMSSGQLPAIRRESKNHREDYRLYMASGLTEEHARMLAAQPDAELATRDYRKFQIEDVVNDPEGAKARAKEAGAELMRENEAAANRITGALGVLMQEQGVGSVRELSDKPGTWEVKRTDESGNETVTLLDENQLDTWIQLSFRNEERARLQQIQSRILGTQLTKDAGATLDFIDTLDVSELGQEIRNDIRQHGGITLNGLNLLARRAAESIAALEASGVERQQALDATDESVIPGVALGDVAQLADAAEQRVQVGVQSGEITQERADSILSGEEKISHVFRMKSAAHASHSMLLHALGEVTAADVAEDVHEATLARYMNDNNVSLSELWQQLQEADKVLDGSLGTYEGDIQNGMHAVEAFSRLSLSNMLSSMEVMDVPEHIKAMATYAKGSLQATRRLLDVGDAWNAFVNTDAGRSFLEKNGTLADVLSEAGNNVSSLLHHMEFEASSADAVLEALLQSDRRAGENEVADASPRMRELTEQVHELERQLARAGNEGDAAALRNEIDNAQALIAAEAGAPYLTPSLDWTARTEEGVADMEAVSMSLADESPLEIHENRTEYKRNGSFYSTEFSRDRQDETSREDRGGLLSPESEGDRDGSSDGRGDSGVGEGVRSLRDSFGLLQPPSELQGGLRFLQAGYLTQRLHRLGGREKAKLALDGFYTGDICELVPGLESAAAFTEAIEAAKASRGLYGECVYVYSAEEYAGMRLFLTPDGLAGMALKEDGDMVSVFSHVDQSKNGEGKAALSLVALAINEGALKGDCYGDTLVKLYGKFGFRAVAKDAFNPGFASEPMQDEKAMQAAFPKENGKPDVVYLVYEGDRTRVMEEFDPDYVPTYQTELEYTDYETCLSIQSAALENRRQTEEQPPPNTSFSLADIDPVIADVRDEMHAIRQKAQEEGTYLLAPNGTQSNLPERLWELVRTVGFKRWFGDWEFDPANASKVLDRKGEPKIVYHANRHDTKAFLFTEEKGQGVSRHGDAFLNIRNPYEAKDQSELDAIVNEDQGNKLVSDGYDGVFLANDQTPPAFVALNSTQIKSATDNHVSFDAETTDISFSLAAPDQAIAPLLASIHNARVTRLYNALKRELNRWNELSLRLGHPNERVPEGEAMEAFGRIITTAGEVNRALPEGFRLNTAGLIREAYDLARRIKRGEATLASIAQSQSKYWRQTERNNKTVASKNLRIKQGREAARSIDAMMRNLLEQLIVNIDNYEKARITGRINKKLSDMSLAMDDRADIEPVVPSRFAFKKQPNGKLKPGKMSADSYRQLAAYASMMNASAGEVEARMRELTAQIDNAETLEEKDKLTADLVAWGVYGNLAGMNTARALAAENALNQFITTQRVAWSEKLRENRKRIAAETRKVVSKLGEATPQELADTKIENTRLRNHVKNGLFAAALNFGQFIKLLERTPGLRAFAKSRLTELAEANVNLELMENERIDDVSDLIRRVTGITSDGAQAKWRGEFGKVRESGIRLVMKADQTFRMSIEDAQQWVNLSEEERDQRRKQAYEEGEDLLPPEDSLSLIVNELLLLESGKIAKRKNITPIKQTISLEHKVTENYRMSRDQAAYLVLLYEQKRYRHNLELSGFGEAEMRQVYDFLGEEGLQIAYGLRDIVNKRGVELTRLYEEREGIPFPAEENYFRAFFEGDAAQKGRDLFDNANASLNRGGKYGMLITRVLHSRHIDYSLGAFSVFTASMNETENYIAVAQIASDWRKRFADRSFTETIRTKMGEHYFRQLVDWVNLLEGAGAIEGASVIAMARAVARFQGVKALAVLAWNALTIIKQTTAIFHSVFSGEGRSWQTLGHIALIATTPGGWKTFSKVLQSDAFAARTKDHKALRKMIAAAPNSNWNAMRTFAMSGMNWMTKMDIWCNAVSMAALYEAQEANLKEFNESNPNDALSQEEIDALCMSSVKRALEVSAQPNRTTQKSAAIVGSNSGFHKAAFFLSSEAMNKFGLFTMHLRNREVGTAIAQMLTIGLMEQLIVYAWRHDKDDEDDAFWKYLVGVPAAMFGSAPVIGEITEGIVRLITGEKIYIGTGSSLLNVGDTLSAINKSLKITDKNKRSKMNENDWYSIVRSFAMASGSTGGALAGSSNRKVATLGSFLLSLAILTNATKPAGEQIFPKEKKKKKRSRISMPNI